MRAPVAMPSTMTRWICGAAASYSRRASLTDGGAIRWALGLAIRSDTNGLESSRRARTAQPYAARRMLTRRCTVDCPTPRWRCTSHQASTSSQVTQCARRWPKIAVSGSACCVVVLLVVGFSSVPAYRSRSSATVAFVADAEGMRRFARRISSRSRICISACTDSNCRASPSVEKLLMRCLPLHGSRYLRTHCRRRYSTKRKPIAILRDRFTECIQYRRKAGLQRRELDPERFGLGLMRPPLLKGILVADGQARKGAGSQVLSRQAPQAAPLSSPALLAPAPRPTFPASPKAPP